MSIHVMSEVWRSHAYEGGTLLTLLALADFANDDHACYPSISTLMAKTRQSERNIQQCLRRLRRDGVITVEPKSGPRSVNVYRIHLEALAGVSARTKSARGGARTSCKVLAAENQASNAQAAAPVDDSDVAAHGATAAPPQSLPQQVQRLQVQTLPHGGAKNGIKEVELFAPKPSLEPSENRDAPGGEGAKPRPADVDSIASQISRGKASHGDASHGDASHPKASHGKTKVDGEAYGPDPEFNADEATIHLARELRIVDPRIRSMIHEALRMIATDTGLPFARVVERLLDECAEFRASAKFSFGGWKAFFGQGLWKLGKPAAEAAGYGGFRPRRSPGPRAFGAAQS